MAEYARITETINAFLVNATSVADEINWPEWIQGITASAFGTWIVQLTTGEHYEVQDETYISTDSTGAVSQRTAEGMSAYEEVVE